MHCYIQSCCDGTAHLTLETAKISVALASQWRATEWLLPLLLCVHTCHLRLTASPPQLFPLCSLCVFNFHAASCWCGCTYCSVCSAIPTAVQRYSNSVCHMHGVHRVQTSTLGALPRCITQLPLCRVSASSSAAQTATAVPSELGQLGAEEAKQMAHQNGGVG